MHTSPASSNVSVEVQTRTSDYLPQKFRTIGNLIRRSGEISAPEKKSQRLTSSDRFVLDAMYRSSKDGICRLSNQEIINRSWVPGQTGNSLTIRLAKLERHGWISRRGRRRRRITLLYTVSDELPLIVDLLANFTPSQLLVIAVVRAFKDVKEWTWWARRVYMEPSTFAHNFQKLFAISPAECLSNPKVFLSHILKFFNSNPKVFCPYNKGIVLGRVPVETESKLSVAAGKPAAHQKTPSAEQRIAPSCQQPTKANPGGPMTSPAPPKSMPPRRSYPLDYVNPNKMHVGLVHQAKMQGKKLEGRPYREVEEMKRLPYISQTKPGSKKYQKLIRVIHALETGLVNNPKVMPATCANMMVKYMTQRFNFTEEQVEDFLTRNFTADERRELYKRLSDNFHPDNAGLGRMGQNNDLDSALWPFSSSGFSLLCKLWIEPAKRKAVRKQEVVLGHNLSPELEHVGQAVADLQHVCAMVAKETGNAPTDHSIITVVQNMHAFFETELRPYHDARFPTCMASFGEFVAGYLRFLDDVWAHWKERQPSKRDFDISCKTFGDWVDEWRYDLNDQVACRNERAREEQAEKEQYQRDYEDTMRGLNW